MKKTFFALTILTTLMASASAQTSVALYGTLDAGVTYASTGNTPPVNVGQNKWSLDSGIDQPSVIGVKGMEDFGGSLKAIFQLEAGVQINSGSSTNNSSLFNRASWVGLTGDFGTVTAGRQFTPLYDALKTLDPFELGLAGTATNLMSIGGANFINGVAIGGNNVSNGGGVVGQNNSMRYASQTVSGWSMEFNYSFGEIAGSIQNGRQMGTTINYTHGPLAALLSYDVANAINNRNTFHTTLLGAVMDWSELGLPLKSSLGYAMNRGSDVTAIADVDSSDLLLGLRYPLGAHELLASYLHKNDHTSANLDAQQFALGYTYALSKRTSFYTSIAALKNKNGADYRVGNASNPGYGVNVFDLGLRHRF